MSSLITLLTIIANPWQRLLLMPSRIHLVDLSLSYLTYHHAHVVRGKRQSVLLSRSTLILATRVHLLILDIYRQVLSTRRLARSLLKSTFRLILLFLLTMVAHLINEKRLIAWLVLTLLWLSSDYVHFDCVSKYL